MRPFEQFRLWARRAPIGERCAAAIVVTIVAASLAWLAFSSSGTDTIAGSGGRIAAGPEAAGSEVAGAAGGATGQIATTQPGVSSGAESPTAGGTGGQPSATGGASAQTGAGSAGCVSPPGSDQGVTDKEIKIAIMLVELGGSAGNSAFAVPSTAEQKAAYEAMLEHLNATNAVACRKVMPLYFTINPLDQANLQQTCLDVVEAKVFFTVDIGGYSAFPAIIDCFIQNKIPFYNGSFVPQAQVEKSYPYLFASGTLDLIYFNMVFGLKEQGFFDPAKGFKKLGFLYQTCVPELPKKVLAWLEEAGVPPSQVVTYSFGCPAGLMASPGDIAQAVLKFQQAGVTHVTNVRGDSDWYTFTRAAEQQRYKPKYGLGDYTYSFTAYGARGPSWENADGTTLISGYRFGEEHTPGYPRSEGTQRCRAIMEPKGQPDMYTQLLGMSGVACNQLWFFASAVNHAPQLKREALAEGLSRGGQIDFSYPHGTATFPTPKTTFHGNHWRTLTAHASCSCWQVTDPTFRPQFPGYR